MIATSYSCRKLALFGFLCALTFRLSAAAEAPPNADREACKQNLTAINAAIKAYRIDHKDLPAWLSDLVPKYIKNPNFLICPVIRKTGAVNVFGLEDPNLSTAYTYEFAEAPVPEGIYGGSDRTMKEWKRLQMGLVGSKVPMVRCHHHDPVLNLAFDGTIYDSGGGWEDNFKDIVDPADLTPRRLFATEAAWAATSKARSEIPPRDPKTPAHLVDLSKHYNAALTESWHRHTPTEPPAADLAWLPRGIQKFGNIEFDTRGLIQLSSPKLNHPRFPQAVKNIKVDSKAVRLHFLHGTGWSAPDGTPVASFVIRLANGDKHQFTVLYGNHLFDWVMKAEKPNDTKNSMLVWTGKTPAMDSQMVLHIYKTHWTNPTPDQPVTSIDYLAANNDPAPFLIAVTAEQP